MTQRRARTPIPKQQTNEMLPDAMHIASAASWVFSIDKAVKKGGAAWIPVFVGIAGHGLAWYVKRNQAQRGMALPRS